MTNNETKTYLILKYGTLANAAHEYCHGLVGCPDNEVMRDFFAAEYDRKRQIELTNGG